MMKALFDLSGRLALVTGGSRGIGRMIAEGFLEQGATVYITARKREACLEAAAQMSANGGRCIALPADVSSLAGIEDLCEQFAAHESRLDILVNNAGAAWAAPFDEFPETGWDKVVDLNLKTPFFLTQKLAKYLRAGASQDIAAAAVYLASRAGDYVVGASLTVDGGVAFARTGLDGDGWD